MNTEPETDLAAAKREVERAKHDLAIRLRAASRSGRQMIQRTVETTKPLLIATASLGAAALLVGIVRLMRSRPRRRGWIAPLSAVEPPGFFSTLLRSVLASAATSLAGHLMDRLARQLEFPESPLPKLSPTSNKAAPSVADKPAPSRTSPVQS